MLPGEELLPRLDWEPRQMSAYENLVGGKLKLKGKALDVKSGAVKKKKKHKRHHDQEHEATGNEYSAGGSTELSTDPAEDVTEVNKVGEERLSSHDDQLTPAEKGYIEQKEKIDVHRLAKTEQIAQRPDSRFQPVSGKPE